MKTFLLQILQTGCYEQVLVFWLWLVGESVRLPVADLVQVGQAGMFDHRRRSAHQNDGVVGGRWQVLADHLVVDEARTIRRRGACRSIEVIVLLDVTHLYF